MSEALIGHTSVRDQGHAWWQVKSSTWINNLLFTQRQWQRYKITLSNVYSSCYTRVKMDMVLWRKWLTLASMKLKYEEASQGLA